MSHVTFDDLHDLSSVAMGIGSPADSLFESTYHNLFNKDVKGLWYAPTISIRFLEYL